MKRSGPYSKGDSKALSLVGVDGADANETIPAVAPGAESSGPTVPTPLRDSLVTQPNLPRNEIAKTELAEPARHGSDTRRLKLRYLRTGPAPSDPGLKIVRGGTLDAAELFMHALRHHRIYGVYGISVFGLESLALDQLARQAPLSCFEQLSVFRVGDVVHGGVHLEPTGHDVRHYTLICEDFHEGVRHLLACRQEVIGNRHYRAAPLPVAEAPEIDLFADLNAEDDDGLGWSTLLYARDPAAVVPGAVLLAGDHEARAVVRVISVDKDGQIHFALTRQVSER